MNVEVKKNEFDKKPVLSGTGKFFLSVIVLYLFLFLPTRMYF